MSVLGTVGHVDHGKSTVLRSLTGQSPDRLPEEKNRGMTIDLNFVWREFKNLQQKVGFVDVPGHHRFIKNMLAGVFQLDAYLFVVAADDGWMPQSEEHLMALKIGQIHHGMAIITKKDLVTSDKVKEVQEYVTNRITDELGVAPQAVLSFCPETAEIEQLQTTVENLIKTIPSKNKDTGTRLWVDRVFSPKGKGVVVTGTLMGSELQINETITHYSSQKKILVKELQMYGSSVDSAHGTSRVAVHLGKVNLDDVHRGDLLQKGKSLSQTKMILASLSFFQPPKKRRFVVTFHVGTARYKAQLVILDELAEGRKEYWAKIYFFQKAPLLAGEKFLCRTSGEEKSIAGGEIIDPFPKGGKIPYLKEFASNEDLSPEFLVNMTYKKYKYLNLLVLYHNSVYSLSQLQNLINEDWLELKEKNSYVLKKDWADWKAQMKLYFIEESQKSSTHTFSLQEVTSKFLNTFGTKETVIEKMFGDFVQEKVLNKSTSGYVYGDATAQVTPEEKNFLVKIKAWEDQEGELPWSLRENQHHLKVIKSLEKKKKVIALSPDYYVTQSVYENVSQRVKDYLGQTDGVVPTAELKAVIKQSRKYAVIYLEKFDKDRITLFKNGGRALFKKVV